MILRNIVEYQRRRSFENASSCTLSVVQTFSIKVKGFFPGNSVLTFDLILTMSFKVILRWSTFFKETHIFDVVNEKSRKFYVRIWPWPPTMSLKVEGHFKSFQRQIQGHHWIARKKKTYNFCLGHFFLWCVYFSSYPAVLELLTHPDVYCVYILRFQIYTLYKYL